MAIERPPRQAALNLETAKSYRPPEDQVFTWHTVTSGMQENFSTIAAKHRVPVEKIIGLNFPGSVENGRVATEVVNWYLRHHKGFGGPETFDRRNRMFKGGEKVAIPFMGRVDVGEPIILLPKKKPVSLDEPGHILSSEKFVHEFKLPPKAPLESGHIAIQFRITIEGEISQPNGVVKTQFKKDQIKAQIEKQIEGDFKVTLSAKYDEKVGKAVADEIAKGSKEGVMRAIAAPVEASLKQNYKFGRFAIVPEFGFEAGEFIKSPDKLPTPVVLRLAGDYQDTLLVDGLMLQGKFTIKVGVNVGLSKKGWAWVAQKVGGETLKRFLASSGQAMSGIWTYLVAEGVVAAGAIAAAAIAGTVVITSLVAWMVQDARRKGELKGLASWYYSAYLAKVFRRPRPSGFIVGDTKMRDDLIILGERDAAAMAMDIVRKRGEQASYPTEAAAIERFREIAIHVFGSEAHAEMQLKKTLQAHIEKQVGL